MHARVSHAVAIHSQSHGVGTCKGKIVQSQNRSIAPISRGEIRAYSWQINRLLTTEGDTFQSLTMAHFLGLNYFHPLLYKAWGKLYVLFGLCFNLFTVHRLCRVVSLDKTVKLCCWKHGRISRPMHDGLSAQPRKLPATNPPPITCHNSKSCAPVQRLPELILDSY